MRQIIYPLSILCMAALLSCSNGGDSLPTPTPIKGKSLPIGEIIQPRGWTIADGKAVVCATPSSDNVFYVYSLPDWKFMYSTGVYGDGPNDFDTDSNIALKGNGDMGYLSLRDYRRNGQISKYAVDNRSIKMTGTIPRPKYGRKKFHIDNIPCIDGKYCASLNFHRGDDAYSIFIDDVESGKHIDSIKTSSAIEVEYDSKGEPYTTRNIIDGKLASRGSRIALMYDAPLIRRVDFYDVSSSGKISLFKSVGDSIDDNLIDRIKAMRDSNARDRVAGCIDIFTTDNHIYMLDIDCKFEMIDNRMKPHFIGTWVRVYDWDGNLTGYYELDAPAMRIIASGDDSYFYTYSSEEDFDHVHRYTLN